MIYVNMPEEFRTGASELLNLFFQEKEYTFAESTGNPASDDILITVDINEAAGGFKLGGFKLNAKILRQNEILYSEQLNVENESEYKKLRSDVKVLLYNCLSRYTGRKLPWGSLTGIRPAKIVRMLFDRGTSPGDAYRKLVDYYRLSESKAELTVEIAMNEEKFIKDAAKKVSIYIGIPFCTSRCIYCSFPSVGMDRSGCLVTGYLEALYREVKWASQWLRDNNTEIDTVYIGGGTPTAISESQLDYLLNFIVAALPLRNVREYTVEAGRPDTLNYEKLNIIKNAGVTRISINPQTMQEKTLRLIGRNHTTAQVIEAFHAARDLGFRNINCDLIAGLPEEDEKDFSDTLNKIGELDPDSVTVHTMAYKRASRLINERENFKKTDDETVNSMVETAGRFLRGIGMRPYYLYRQKNILANLENVGYAKPGAEGIYNILIMEEVQTILALGAGASTKIIYPENRIERIFNVRNVEQYIQRIDEMIDRKMKLLGI